MNIFKSILSICIFALSTAIVTADTMKPGDYEDYRNHSVVVKGLKSFGTGVVVDMSPDGKNITILTANHILRTRIKTPDGKVQINHLKSVIIYDQFNVAYSAKVVTSSIPLDVALVRITSKKPIETSLKPVSLMRTSPLLVGEDVFILGNKLGLAWSFSFGKIMHPKRVWPGLGGMIPFIQVDAITNAGDSGGGLFDAEGSLIGIILQKHKRSLLGFAIPITEVCKLKMEDKMQDVFHCGLTFVPN